MFAKILSSGDRLMYVTNVKDIQAGPLQTHFKETLTKDGYENIPGDEGEVYGRTVVIRSEDEEDCYLFCDHVIYLCSETGQTADRIMCSGSRNV